MRVDRVGLAALAGGEHPCPRRHFRGHIDYGLAVGDQALGDVSSDAVAALPRPQPVPVTSAELEHRLIAVGVGGETALCKNLLAFVDDLDGGRAFVWIHPDDDLSHP